MIYGIRLIDDVLVKNILMIYQTPTYVFGYFFGLTMMPVIAVSLLYRPSDTRIIFRYFLFFLVAANILLFMYAVVRGDFTDGIFSGRIQEAGEVAGNTVLGPIWLGYAGAMLASMLFGIFATSGGISRTRLIAGIALMGIAGANILFGSSRGPMVGLALAILLFLFRPGRVMAGTKNFVSRWRGWAITLGVIGLSVILIIFSNGSIFLVERFASMYEERLGGGTELRDIIFATAWQDFLSSPIIGTSYVVSVENWMPHNFILESLIATGVVGSAFLFVALVLALRGLLRLLAGAHGPEGVYVGLAATVQIALGFTSGSISQSPGLWIFIALVTVMGAPDAKSRKITKRAKEYQDDET